MNDINLPKMSSQDKKAWLSRHGKSVEGGNNIVNGRVYSLWKSYNGLQYIGMGFDAEAAEDDLFMEVYSAFFRQCLDDV